LNINGTVLRREMILFLVRSTFNCEVATTLQHNQDLVTGNDMTSSRLALLHVRDYEAAKGNEWKGIINLENAQSAPLIDAFRTLRNFGPRADMQYFVCTIPNIASDLCQIVLSVC